MTNKKIANTLKTEYGISGSISRLAGENENYLIALENGVRYVLKIASGTSMRDRILLENAAVEAVVNYGTGLSLPRLIPNKNGETIITLGTDSDDKCFGRLLQFVAGEEWGEKTPASNKLLTSLGQMIAHIAKALAAVDLPAARTTHSWDLASAGSHRESINLIDDPVRWRILALQFERWAAIAQDLITLPHGLIHGDLNDDNLLVMDGEISGILDFGDALYNPLICDLAISLAYILLYEPDPWRSGAIVVAGYHSVRHLSATEVELLYPLICARLGVSLGISAKRRQVDPNREAWFVTEEKAWAFLEQYGNADPAEIADKLAAAIDVRPFADRGDDVDRLLSRRTAVTSAANSISYHKPIKFIRGRGAYLIDEHGRPFLDLYNNVCHVGHCHPHVVKAGQRQMARLNTNTRYLTDSHVSYAERLVEKLPAQLDTVFFVNSGSEANELALRLAYTHTGHEDVLIVENAYHGHTRQLIDLSPYKFMGKGGKGRPEAWVHVVSVPDGFRGPYKGQSKETGRAYANAVGKTIQTAKRPFAAFMAETLLSCGGQVIPPPGYFETVFDHVRNAGGVCILDEVQVGFGRIGSHFWAFEAFNVIPDIVVLGKPIGNGHPMAAVVCSYDIAESFEANGMEYFSTFGGNPVSCEIGNAVLDVIETQKLQAHAQAVGTYFLDSLYQIKSQYQCIGDVRGTGLFLGIDLVKSDGITPATELAGQIVNDLRGKRILTGTDGPFNNVIKIKPPLVVSKSDVDRFIFDLNAILTAKSK